MLRVRVLGQVVVEHDGRPLEVPTGRPRLVVAFLALHPGRQPRRRVAEQLWPDSSPPAAAQLLRTALWEVQRALSDVPEPLVVADRHEVGLHPDVSVDLADARRWIEDNPSAAAEAADPGLAAVLDHDWAEAARLAVEALRLKALESAAQRTADLDAAVAYARRRVALQPLSEAAHRDLIRLLAGGQDRAAAMAAYEDLRRVLDSELGIGPSATSRRLLADLAAEHPAPAASMPPRSRRPVPSAPTPLLGRDADLAEVARALDPGRLVTLVGPGGVGKTRVAFAVAQHAADRGQRVAVVELATTPTPETCELLLAEALGVQAGPAREVRDAVVDALDLEPTLLVLDNCEHVLGVMRELVAHLLRWSPRTRLLATSREPLAVAGEHVLRLLPLAVPPPGADERDILATPAVQLLLDAANRAALRVRLDGGRSEELARLARQLDGLPLALELAAARIPTLGISVLEERLQAGLDVVSVGSAAAGSRHDSLITTLEWSMTMLSPQEKVLLGLLSLLPGRFPLSAVERLVEAAGVITDPLVGLARLVEASLVQVHQDDGWCYSELETIRAFGSDLLDERTAARGRAGLVQWAMQFADDVGQRGDAAEAALHVEMVRFLPLVRAALHEARRRGDLAAQRRILVGIENWSTWRVQPEFWAWLADLAAQEPADGADAEVLRMGAVAAWRLGRLDEMRELTSRCVAADPDGDLGMAAAPALMMLAWAEQRWADVPALAAPILSAGGDAEIITTTVVVAALVRAGRPEAASDMAREARLEAERLGAPTPIAVTLLAEARVAAALESVPAGGGSEQVLARARQLADSVGSAEVVASIDKERGLQALRRGLVGRAVAPLRSACLHWLGTGNNVPLPDALAALVEALASTGRHREARGLSEAARDGTLTSALLTSLVTLEEDQAEPADIARLAR